MRGSVKQNVVAGDLNLIPKNILNGVVIAGVEGTLIAKCVAGDHMLRSISATLTVPTTLTKIREIQVLADGVIRVSYLAGIVSGGTGTMNIKVNEVSKAYDNSFGSVVTYSHDITVARGDLIQFYAQTIVSGKDLMVYGIYLYADATQFSTVNL